MTPLQQQVLDAARRWTELRPPHANGAPARSTVQAAEMMLERGVLAMEAAGSAPCDAIEIEQLTAERDHYRAALAEQTARVRWLRSGLDALIAEWAAGTTEGMGERLRAIRAGGGR